MVHHRKYPFVCNQSICKVWSCYVHGLGGDAFTRKNIISPLTLILGQEQTRNFAQYLLHHMTYAPAKFEVAMPNGLGRNAFTRNTWPKVNVTWSIALYTMWPIYL